MKLKTVKYLVLILAIAALGIAGYGLAAVPQGTALYDNIVWISGACLVADGILLAFFSRCPHCGKLLLAGMLRMDRCPKCKKQLYGMPKSNYKGRRLK